MGLLAQRPHLDHLVVELQKLFVEFAAHLTQTSR